MAGALSPAQSPRATIEAVADFVTCYAVPMAERVYGDAALPPVERNAATLARHIRKSGAADGQHSRADAPRPACRECAKLPTSTLRLRRWWKLVGCVADPHRKGGSTGRAMRDYAVNPAIWRE
jgi:hypothetical protein